MNNENGLFIISTCINCPDCGGEPYKTDSLWEGILNCSCLDCDAQWYEHGQDEDDE